MGHWYSCSTSATVWGLGASSCTAAASSGEQSEDSKLTAANQLSDKPLQTSTTRPASQVIAEQAVQQLSALEKPVATPTHLRQDFSARAQRGQRAAGEKVLGAEQRHCAEGPHGAGRARAAQVPVPLLHRLDHRHVVKGHPLAQLAQLGT